MRNTSASANTHEDLNSMLIAAVTNPLGEVVDTQTVAELLARGANVNAARPNGTTALMLAARNSHIDIVSTLLDGGAKVDEARPNGFTALMFAARNGHTDIVSALLNRSAEVNKATSDGSTALMIAAENGHTRSVLALLERGAEVNEARSSDGFTARLVNSSLKPSQCVRILVCRI
jgi:ankyrin repeat protein